MACDGRVDFECLGFQHSSTKKGMVTFAHFVVTAPLRATARSNGDPSPPPLSRSERKGSVILLDLRGLVARRP